jgi:hypothetical protein
MAQNNLNDVLRNLGREGTPPDIHRLAEEMAGRLRQDLAQTKSREHPMWREYLMRNRIVQLAVAAAILVVVGVVLHYLGASPDGVSVAWGEVLAQVQNVPVITYKMKMTIAYPEGRQWRDESDVYIGRQYGSRIDSYMDGRLYMVRYLVPARKALLMVHPQLKRYMEQTLSDEQVVGTLEQQDPRQWIEWVLSWEHRELGRSEIDGVAVEGIEAEREDKETLRLWVDVKTNWPVRIESEGQMMHEGQLRPSHIVLDHFRWDGEIDPGLFEPNIPADYTLSGPR